MTRSGIRYYPRHTNDLRLIVKTLGFKATGMSTSGYMIYYTNEERNPYKKIRLPKSNHINKDLASEVLVSLEEDFNCTEKEIFEACKEIHKTNNS